MQSLDLLRGYASLLVVISHLLGVFWVAQPALQKRLGYSALDGVSLRYVDLIADNRLFLGQFGVAVFFILSGYVITSTLQRSKKVGFLINRLIRIYPVYIVGFSFAILGLNLIDIEGDGIPYSFEHIIIHYFIVFRHWLGFAKIDGVSWTLEIEVYFYGIMFVLFQFKKKSWVIFFSLIVFLASSVLVGQKDWYLGRQILMISYMLIGYFIYKYEKKEISCNNLTAITTLQLSGMLLFFMCTKPFSHNPWGWFQSYAYAPILFTLVLVYMQNIKLDVVSQFFADISYPLYVVHVGLGYPMLVFLMQNSYTSAEAMVVTLIVILTVAYVIHIYIEKPSVKFSKYFNK